MPRLAPTLALVLVAAQALGCGPPLEAARVERVRALRAAWRASPVASYSIVVDVERPNERRRNEVSVVGGALERGHVAYWERERGRFGAARELRADQARPFTVEGLFDTLEDQLAAGGRSSVRFALGELPAFPRLIVLGPVLQAGRIVEGSASTLRVVSFAPAPPGD